MPEGLDILSERWRQNVLQKTMAFSVNTAKPAMIRPTIQD